MKQTRVATPAAVALCCGFLPLFESGCTTYRETQPPQTATQELLVSHAAEIAAGRLAETFPPGMVVFLDAAHFKGDGSDYALSAIRAALLRRGVVVAADQKDSKVTVELRMGALSIDQKDTVLGMPATTLPIPGTITAFPIPELSLYSSKHRIGKAEFAAFAYDTKTGAPIAFAGPVGAERDLVKHHYLIVFSDGAELEAPKGVEHPQK
ncbi:MAG: hypothetical protein JO303_05665 [Caulobacteraceae bacterium]|nr:hypothetical protein [Caulobacteraceae bacterium]